MAPLDIHGMGWDVELYTKTGQVSMGISSGAVSYWMRTKHYSPLLRKTGKSMYARDEQNILLGDATMRLNTPATFSVDRGWDHILIPEQEQLFVYGHEMGARLYDLQIEPNVILDVGKIVAERGGLFVNVAQVSGSNLLVGSYNSRPNPFVAIDLPTGLVQACDTSCGAPCTTIKVSPSGRLCALAGDRFLSDSKVSVIDIADGRLLHLFRGTSPLSWLADDQLLYSDVGEKQVTAFHVGTSVRTPLVTYKGEYVSALQVCEAGVLLSIQKQRLALGELYLLTPDGLGSAVLKTPGEFGYLWPLTPTDVLVGRRWTNAEDAGWLEVVNIVSGNRSRTVAYDAGYGHEDMYSPCAVSSDGQFRLIARTRRASCRVFAGPDLVEEPEIRLPNWSPALAQTEWPDEHYVVHSIRLSRTFGGQRLLSCLQKDKVHVVSWPRKST